MAAQLPNRIFASPVVMEEKHPGQMIQQGWIPDERDSFISWLRSEFAAANAVIDAMCQHLQMTSSSPGEYDLVLNCLRQRRFNWSPVLNLQQYYSVEEVVVALQQVALKRRQMHAIGSGGDWVDSPPEPPSSSNSSSRKINNRGGAPEKPEAPESIKPTKNHEHENNGSSRSCAKPEELGSGQPDSSNHSTSGQPEPEANCAWNRANEKSLEDGHATPSVKISKNFQSFENVDGRVVNVVEGLRVCENVFSASESDQLVGTLKELQGRKVELGATGYKIVGGKRIFKSRSNESLQHQPVAGDNSDELQKSSLQDETTESLPVTLQAIIDRLLDRQILPASKRPDSYIVNFLGEGGYLPPQTNNQEFDQPFCIITLQSEYSMVFGRFITMDSPREFRSQFKLVLSVGSVVVLQGNSAKLARYAIPALPSKRCCFVLGKGVSKRFSRNMGFQRSASSGGLINRPGGVQTLSPVNVSAPGFNPGNSPGGAQGGPFPPLPVLSPGWSPVVPRPGRLMTGTGVFLPYNASSSGPGRPNSNHRGNINNNSNKQGGGPVLHKMNSLPASFRATQNGVSSSGGSGKGVVEENHHHHHSEGTSSSSAPSTSAPADHQGSSSIPGGSDEASSSS